MSSTPSDRDLASSLMMLTCELNGIRTSVSRGVGLTPQQAELLCQLEHGTRTHGELAELLHCDKTNVTGLVDRLERRGLVRREANAGDRRVAEVVLTDDGVEMVDRFRAASSTVIGGGLAGWTREQREALVRLARSTTESLRG